MNEVKVERDVVYSTAEGYWAEAPDSFWGQTRLLFRRSGALQPIELKMDIYMPADDQGARRPLLLMLHGGSYLFGHKTEAGQAEWCRYFASLGYVAASIDYRLGFHLDKDDFSRAEKQAVEDAENALGYLLGRADLLIDAGEVFLAGTSAGAAVSLFMAYRSDMVRSCRIRAVANLWGYVHDLHMLENATVPILSFQSERDPVVPYKEGYPMHARILIEKTYGTFSVHEKAMELGIPSEHHPCPEKRHRLHLDRKGAFTPRFYEIRDRMAAFFDLYQGTQD